MTEGASTPLWCAEETSSGSTAPGSNLGSFRQDQTSGRPSRESSSNTDAMKAEMVSSVTDTPQPLFPNRRSAGTPSSTKFSDRATSVSESATMYLA